MKKTLWIALTAVLMAVIANAQSATDEKKFRALERKMFDASILAINGQPAAFMQMLDAEYFTINADGSSSDAKGLDFSKLAAFHISRIDTADFRMRRFGNVVVINGRSAYYSGEQKAAEVLHTEVWVKRGKDWKFAGWQGTMLPPPSAQK